ncbi:MAG TPA: elongation factor P [Candidatus Xenobia bacterium]|jgi:elongation factor P
MISSNDFRNNITIDLEGTLYTIVEFQHVKPGKGSAFVRTKLKNVKTGYTVDKTFRAGEKVNRAIVERREMQFLYHSGEEYTFMDVKTYEQLPIQGSFLGDSVKWLKDSMLVQVLVHEGLPLGVDLPNFVDLKVMETEPGFKGDTATGASKPAKLETGATINVPLFVDAGDVIQIDTRTGEYMKRV